MYKLVLAASVATFSFLSSGIGVAQDKPIVTGEGNCGHSVTLCYTDADGVKTCRSETVFLPCEEGGGSGGGSGGEPGGDAPGGGGTVPGGPNP
jgi:hypothetical protein